MKDIKLLKSSFLNSYLSVMKYLMFISNSSDDYRIIVTKDTLNNYLDGINIIIEKNYFKRENNSICYKNSIVLASDDASELIDAIRNDFKDKHDIMYASINNGVQVIKNNNFSLFVNLNNDKDIEKARIFNSIVNTKNKKLTLTKVI